MKRLFGIVFATIALVAGAWSLILINGCETQSANGGDSPVTVTPAEATLTVGQQQTFVASGGFDYTWKLVPDDGSGKLDTSTGNRVVYTCVATNIGSTPKKVVVDSTINGTSATGASNASYQVEGSAEVIYPNGTAGGGGAITITPSSITISTNTTPRTQTFSASGGNNDFTWSVGDATRGNVSPATGSTTLYTAIATNVSNTVICNDSAGHSAQATVNE